MLMIAYVKVKSDDDGGCESESDLVVAVKSESGDNDCCESDYYGGCEK